MNFLIITLLVFLSILNGIAGNEGNGAINAVCGTILKTDADTISYRRFSALSANQSCVWIVKAADMSNYQVTVHSMGFSKDSNETRLIIMGISSDPAQEDVQVVPREPGTFTFENHQVLMITLYTGVNGAEDTGFLLQYVASPGNAPALGGSSTDMTLEMYQTLYAIRYPARRANYSNNEITTFRFDTPTWRQGIDAIQMHYVGGELEGDCRDSLTLYVLSRDTAELVPHRICDDTPRESKKIDSFGFLVFKSDESVTDTGFSLGWRKDCP